MNKYRVRNKNFKTVSCFSGSRTSELFNLRTWDQRSPWNILQAWTLSTPFWRLKKLTSKVVIVQTNEDRKLLLFYLIFGGVGGSWVFYLSAWSTTFPCLILGGWNYVWGWRFFLQLLKLGGWIKWYCATLEIYP